MVGSLMEFLLVSYLREQFEQASGWSLELSTAKKMSITAN